MSLSLPVVVSSDLLLLLFLFAVVGLGYRLRFRRSIMVGWVHSVDSSQLVRSIPSCSILFLNSLSFSSCFFHRHCLLRRLLRFCLSFSFFLSSFFSSVFCFRYGSLVRSGRDHFLRILFSVLQSIIRFFSFFLITIWSICRVGVSRSSIAQCVL